MMGDFLAPLRVRGPVPFPQRYTHHTALSLPFQGWWVVANGGVDEKTSHSWDILNQRYAYDFYVDDVQGCTHRGQGSRLEDYYAFGKPVLAPAQGVVVRARDGVRDHPRPGSGRLDWWTRDFRGNFVVIRHSGREYSFIGHFKKGSISVTEGDPVRRGQPIGLCGNSGHSTEPHIHFHVQDHPNFYLAVSLPVKFSNLLIDGSQPAWVEREYVSRGQRVRNWTDHVPAGINPN